MPAALVLLEGRVVGVIAPRSASRLRWRLSCRAMSPASSFLESAISRTFKKYVCLRAAAIIIACVVSVALIPSGTWGAAVLVKVIASRVLLAGVVTVRSVIWNLNFARHQRARATSQLR